MAAVCGYRSGAEPASERGDVFCGPFPSLPRAVFIAKAVCMRRLIARTMDGHLPSEHISRDATAIEAREKAILSAPKPKAAKPKRRKRGRPRKGEARAKEPRRLERQLTMSLPQMLADLPRACDVGSKRNAKGHTTSWIVYGRPR